MSGPVVTQDTSALAARFAEVRARTLALVDGLDAEDLVPQSMDDASPGKWHLAHTTWFFDAMVLEPFGGGSLRPDWHYLFNSYYDTLGARHPRPQRGLLTRPALAEVLGYRRAVEDRVRELLARAPADEALRRIEIGTHHEQQHQELMVTDLKHLLSHNPLQPAWRAPPSRSRAALVADAEWIEHEGEGVAEIGHRGSGFCFDNERPAHREWLRPFALAARTVSCAEYLQFIDAGGYAEPRWWLSDGWAMRSGQGWQAPLYWRHDLDGWSTFTAYGRRAIAMDEPVCHLSHYEADAYARWAGARLPTEAEWETIAQGRWRDPRRTDAIGLHPDPLDASGFAPGVWEWTASSYLPYPGFRADPGALGEYNGKFMSGQMVLRGASVATPPGHSRPTYRNFFAPAARWQFSGLRLARDLA
jgi:ergothioneine biosynthesis protein EgtB